MPSLIFHSHDVPRTPGVYVYRDSAGLVIYVGKARNLRARMSQYFRPSSQMREDPRRRALIQSIASYEIFPVETEAEALLLETRFIKQYEPRYNVLMRDDKRFYHIRIDMTEDFPRLVLARLRRDDNRIYLGPFPQAQALHNTVDFLNKHFHLRTCQAHSPSEEEHKHCLEHIIRGCMCPCIGKVTRDEYHAVMEKVLDLFRGNGAPALLAELYDKMKLAAQNQEFEEAARWRDIYTNLKSVLEPARRFRNQTMITRGAASDPEGMQSLMETLHLPSLPLNMECFDMSNIAGTMVVGSMVHFTNGKPDSSQYRRFKIRSETALDDTAFMAEVLERRYTRLLQENKPLPDLIVLDGGLGQVNAATAVFRRIGLDKTPFVGLAKQYETIIQPYGAPPILLPRDNPGLKLLQAIRDEAHRFANGYNRQLRNKRITDSLLAEIPGVGPKRRVQLLKTFGSVRELAKLTPQQMTDKLPSLGIKLASVIADFLQKHSPQQTDSE